MPAPEANPVEAGFLGDYTSAAADGQGMVVVWADTRGLYGQNEQDVYLAQLATAGGGLPMPGSPNTGVSTETPGP